jgi:heme b synthase
LTCIHCRASAHDGAPEGELTLDQYKALLDNIASFSAPIIILTGGEPLLREDLFDIAAHGTGLGLRVAVSTNGTLITDDTVDRLKGAGVQTCSISLDGSNAEVHDDFRREKGAFDASVDGLQRLKEAGLKVQVNSSLTRRNMHELEPLFNLVRQLGADAWHVFMLVPTGRAEETGSDELITSGDYERILNQIYEWDRDQPMEIKPTCAPQYYRILRQRAKADGIPVDVEHFGLNARTRGCLAGIGFGFVSYKGEVFPCGYYTKMAGDVTQKSFKEIWEAAPLFKTLRNFKNYEGACGRCAFLKVCGGCRARSYALTGNDLAEEPYCSYGESR